MNGYNPQPPAGGPAPLPYYPAPGSYTAPPQPPGGYATPGAYGQPQPSYGYGSGQPAYAQQPAPPRYGSAPQTGPGYGQPANGPQPTPPVRQDDAWDDFMRLVVNHPLGKVLLAIVAVWIVVIVFIPKFSPIFFVAALVTVGLWFLGNARNRR